MEREPIKSHKDLEVYQMAFDAAMKIFELSKKFPIEERYSLTDQIRRSSRSVCANMAEVAAPLGSFLKSCRQRAARESDAMKQLLYLN
jgi:four helix bundle protein